MTTTSWICLKQYRIHILYSVYKINILWSRTSVVVTISDLYIENTANLYYCFFSSCFSSSPLPRSAYPSLYTTVFLLETLSLYLYLSLCIHHTTHELTKLLNKNTPYRNHVWTWLKLYVKCTKYTQHYTHCKNTLKNTENITSSGRPALCKRDAAVTGPSTRYAQRHITRSFSHHIS